MPNDSARIWRLREVERARRMQRIERQADRPDRGAVEENVKRFPRLEPVDLNGVLSQQLDYRRSAPAPRIGRIPDGHDTSFAMPPYECLPEEKVDGGNPPATHYVKADPGGVLQIVTAIADDSSQLRSKAEFQGRVEPKFGAPWSNIRFSPWVTFQAQRYLGAAGFGESYSDGYVKTVVVSTAPDGSDWQESETQSVTLWSDRVSSGEIGQQLGSTEWDFEGHLDPLSLEINVRAQHDRVYYWRIRAESNSDADGGHLLYASHASVALYVDVHWMVVEQTGPFWG